MKTIKQLTIAGMIITALIPVFSRGASEAPDCDGMTSEPCCDASDYATPLTTTGSPRPEQVYSCNNLPYGYTCSTSCSDNVDVCTSGNDNNNYCNAIGSVQCVLTIVVTDDSGTVSVYNNPPATVQDWECGN